MSSRSHIVALAAVFALAGGSCDVAAQQRLESRPAINRREIFRRRLDAGIVTGSAPASIVAINRSRINGSRTETDINSAVNDFKLATDRLGREAESPRDRHRRSKTS